MVVTRVICRWWNSHRCTECLQMARFAVKCPTKCPEAQDGFGSNFAECLSSAFHNYGNVSMKRIPLLAEEGRRDSYAAIITKLVGRRNPNAKTKHGLHQCPHCGTGFFSCRNGPGSGLGTCSGRVEAVPPVPEQQGQSGCEGEVQGRRPRV